jgi:hypothetical protein
MSRQANAQQIADLEEEMDRIKDLLQALREESAHFRTARKREHHQMNQEEHGVDDEDREYYAKVRRLDILLVIMGRLRKGRTCGICCWPLKSGRGNGMCKNPAFKVLEGISICKFHANSDEGYMNDGEYNRVFDLYVAAMTEHPEINLPTSLHERLMTHQRQQDDYVEESDGEEADPVRAPALNRANPAAAAHVEDVMEQ